MHKSIACFAASKFGKVLETYTVDFPERIVVGPAYCDYDVVEVPLINVVVVHLGVARVVA